MLVFLNHLIAHNISPVLSIFASHFIRDWVLHCVWPLCKTTIIVIIIYIISYLTSSCVINQPGTCFSEYEPLYTASSHITWVLNWLRASCRCHGSTSTALMPNVWILKQSRTSKNAAGLIHIASLYMSWALDWPGTDFSIYGFMRTASSHVSWVLKRFGQIPRSVV